MKTTLCVIGAVLALSAATPVLAQDSAEASWAPWMNQTVESPAPRVRPAQAAPVAPVVAQAPQAAAEVVSRRLLRIDRFWVIGSFR